MAHMSNAIVQMMIDNHKRKAEADQLEAQKQQHKDLMDKAKRDQDINEMRARTTQQQVENEHELQSGRLDDEHKIAQAKLNTAKLEAADMYRKHILAGGDPAAFQEPGVNLPPQPDLGITGGVIPGSATPQGMVDIPNLGRRAISSFPTREQMEAANIRQKANEITGTVQAKGEAEAPLLDKAAERARETERLKQVQDETNREKQLGITGQSVLDVANVHQKAAESEARIRGGYELANTRLRSTLGGDQEGVIDHAQQQHEALMNGQINYKDLSTINKRLEDGYSKTIKEIPPSDGKTYKEGLDNVSQMQELINQARHLAVNYSRDSPGASAGGNQNLTLGPLGTLQRTVPGSDLESEMNNLKSMSGSLAKQFEGQKRSSDATIARSAVGVFDPKATQEQNLQKVNDHIKAMQPVVRNSFVGQSPDRINSVLKARGINDFGAYGVNAAQAPAPRDPIGVR